MRKHFKGWFAQRSSVWKYIVPTIPVLVFVWLGYVWYKVDKGIIRTDPTAATADVPTIKFVPSPLTGINISQELAQRPIIAAQIENSIDARPQSGLEQAGVIIEAIAEAGITRFTAYYQEAEPAVLGPIRSLRPYFIDWLLGFDASVVHVGGSTEAKELIPQLGVKSLDVSGAYYRANDRFAPHNAYSSYDIIRGVMERLGYYYSPNFTPIERKAEAPLTTPVAGTITIDISSSLFNLTYGYDVSCNCYRRNMGGVPHKDRESGNQLSPKVVVALRMPQRVIDGVGHIGMDTIGSGEGWVFQDGAATQISWSKTSRQAQLTFTDSSGVAVGLNAGQTWITMVPPDQNISFAL